MKPIAASFLTVAVIVLTVIYGLSQPQLPKPVAETADPTVFSCARTMKHLRLLAAHPRNVGSPEHAKARDYIMSELRALGLNPFVQKTTPNLTISVTRASVVENIIAVAKGTANSKAVLLAAHYDSVPLAPGAGDDGYAVAAIFETIRALKARGPLRNDLIILITDEEVGLFGAKAFVQESPLADSIGFAMNFEGRGVCGPSLMFETTAENGWVVREFSKAISTKASNSLTYDLYRLLPNNTDFTFFKQKASSGLNFAHIGGVRYYHSVYDDADHLDEQTLQHHGNNMLEAALHFGNIDLRATKAPDVVYFTFPLLGFVVYPMWWTKVYMIGATLLFAFVIYAGFKTQRLRVWRFILSTVLFLVEVLFVGGIVFLLWKWLAPLQPEFGLYYLHTIHNGDLYFFGFIAFGILLTLVLHVLLTKLFGIFNASAGPLFIWLIVSWLAALYAPGGSFLLVWPLIFGLAGFAYVLTKEEDVVFATDSIVVTSLCTVPGVFLYAELLQSLYDVFTLIAVSGIIALSVFFFGTIQFSLAVLLRRRWWLFAAFFFLAATGFIGTAIATRTPSPHFPKPNSIFYATDADSGTAVWATWDEKLDEWTQQFFPSRPDTVLLSQYFPEWKSPILSHRTSPVGLDAPEAELLSDETDDTVRTLSIRVSSSRGGFSMCLFADSSTRVYDSRVNGKTVDAPLDLAHFLGRSFFPQKLPQWILYYYADSSDALELEVEVPAFRPFRMRVVDRSLGLPQALTASLKPRPAWMIPRPNTTTDVTLVGKMFAF